jgi:Ca-activated chloride channel homolog
MDPADLALIIALDSSASVTFDEFNLIANGCGGALRDPEVVAGLTNGPHGASFCALLLWSGHAEHEISIDWTRLASSEQVEQFASDVENTPRFGLGGLTAIGSALEVCEAMLASLPAPASRHIIDVAGDGGANDGPAPGVIRDRLVAAGVTINGLCVLHEEPDLVETYTRDVIGGPGAFALQCQDYAGFAEGMRQKLQREIAAIGWHLRGAAASRGGADALPLRA